MVLMGGERRDLRRHLDHIAIGCLPCLLLLAIVLAAPRAANGASTDEPPNYNPGATKPIPEVFRIRLAKYDGRLLTLDVEVPGPGKVFLRIPTSCGMGEPADCHRKTLIVRRAAGKGHLIIRQQMSIRIDSSGRLNVAARMERPNGRIVSLQRPKVHRVVMEPRR